MPHGMTMSASIDTVPTSPRLPSLPGRLVAVVCAPRTLFEAVVRTPRWAGILALTFLVSAVPAAVLLQTEVGRLALVDQWERVAAAFGQNVDDTRYAAMEEASQNGFAYAAVSSLAGGPALAAGTAAICFVAFGAARRGGATYRQLLAVVAHAGVILALRQVIVAPIAYARETLASPVTMSLFFTMLDEASPTARFLGIIDLFVLWWIVVLAIGLSVLFARPARRLALIFVAVYLTLALLLAAAMVATGGTT